MTVRTELEWGYEPLTAFEAATECKLTDGRLLVDRGRALLTMDEPSDPVASEVRQRIEGEVNAIFLSRQMITRTQIKSGGPHIVQHEAGGGRRIAVSVGGVVGVGSVGPVDSVVRDANGTVIRDTKAEHMAAETGQAESLATKIPRSPALKRMVESFARAMEDPRSELVHFYEARDAASKHYGGEGAAPAALGLTKADWPELGRLANDEPVSRPSPRQTPDRDAPRNYGGASGSAPDSARNNLDVCRNHIAHWTPG